MRLDRKYEKFIQLSAQQVELLGKPRGVNCLELSGIL